MHLRFRIFIIALLILVAAAACQGPPPTMYVLVVTATESPAEVVSSPGAVTSGSVTPQSATATDTPPTNAVTPTLSVFPTVTVNQIQVAEQRFQHGRMFWLQPIQQVWVLAANEDDPTQGTWTVYTDTWVDGEQESDPRLTPPSNYLQPVRGFGKLWRQNPEIKDAIGWALEAEVGHVARYEYHPGGTVDAQGTYVKDHGYHILYSAWGDAFRFDEETGTWRLEQ